MDILNYKKLLDVYNAITSKGIGTQWESYTPRIIENSMSLTTNYQDLISVIGKGFIDDAFTVSEYSGSTYQVDILINIDSNTIHITGDSECSGYKTDGIVNIKDIVCYGSSSSNYDIRSPNTFNITHLHGNSILSTLNTTTSGGILFINQPIFYSSQFNIAVKKVVGSCYFNYRISGGYK